MALKIVLKADEKLIIGGAVIRANAKGATIFVENKIPLLREKDIMSEVDAKKTPCNELYFNIQLMYIDAPHLEAYRTSHESLAQKILEAAPSTRLYLGKIEEQIKKENFYQALKAARNLIKYEEELLEHGKQPRD